MPRSAPEKLDLTTVKDYGEKQPITLVVSLGPIPDVAGLSVKDAQDKLAAAELTGVSSLSDWSDTIPAGNVIRAQLQNGATTVAKGGTVDLVISKGVPQVPVPDVVGKTWTQAQKILAEQGFKVKFKNRHQRVPVSVPETPALSRSIRRPGPVVDKGATVTIALQAG